MMRQVDQEHHEMQRIEMMAETIKGLAQHIHPPVPNPAPLGLIGFGLTTSLLQMKHTRITGSSAEDMQGVDTVILGFALFFGGLLQIIAGVSEVKRNNIFGYTAFSVYGGFWMSFATVEIITLLATGDAPPPVNPQVMQAMLFVVGVISGAFWILTFKMNKTINVLFLLLTITCILLSFGVQNETVDIVGGYFGLATGAAAFWLAFAELVNDIYGEGREVIPLGNWHFGKRDPETHPEPRRGAAHVPGRIQAHHVASHFVMPRSKAARQQEALACTTTTQTLDDAPAQKREDRTEVPTSDETIEDEITLSTAV